VRDKLVVSIKNKYEIKKEKKRMDSRLRGNDIKGRGNDTRGERE